MEDSLRRTSARGQEVLQQVRRRNEDWWSARAHSGRSPRLRHSVEALEEERPASLEEAFSAMSSFMRHTTELCERYHSCVPAPEMSRSEMQHISRFHCGRRQRVPTKPPPPGSVSDDTAPLQSSGRTRDPQDVYIEVAPGTYRISAASPNYRKQSHVVNLSPGQSVDLTFHV
ncbi:A-kinase-interacting protein 1 isoform X2 [Anomaloglossus baeobatrachus]|uniref:A-kinase-interacting protein 1 isoform X2 n=1 Tax=Anomaloglossus baeobatrachus TaxID=238106 RepID=UPI003F5091EB